MSTDVPIILKMGSMTAMPMHSSIAVGFVNQAVRISNSKARRQCAKRVDQGQYMPRPPPARLGQPRQHGIISIIVREHGKGRRNRIGAFVARPGQRQPKFARASVLTMASGRSYHRAPNCRDATTRAARILSTPLMQSSSASAKRTQDPPTQDLYTPAGYPFQVVRAHCANGACPTTPPWREHQSYRRKVRQPSAFRSALHSNPFGVDVNQKVMACQPIDRLSS